MNNNLASKEAVKYKFPHFYYEIYPLRSKSEYLPENPWHWHTEFELCYVREGSVIYKSSNQEIKLKKVIFYLLMQTWFTCKPLKKTFKGFFYIKNA